METQVFRFKFEETILEEMKYFSKIHKYDSIQDFKEAWKLWTQNNNQLIENEIIRLKRLGYQGDVHKKMFKSVRYYFSKKSDKEKKQNAIIVKKDNGEIKRQYITIPNNILKNIDDFIKINGIHNRPSKLYQDFCENYKNDINNLKNNLKEERNFNDDDCEKKIKKTFKNRFFKLNKYICLQRQYSNNEDFTDQKEKLDKIKLLN